MEKAIYITSPADLNPIRGKYDRLYFGQEFCERLIPAPTALKRALQYARVNALRFSLVTPYVTNHGLQRLLPLFGILEQLDVSPEVVINDWGVLNILNRRFPRLIPVLGRLLTKQKRGPRLIPLLKREDKSRLIQDRIDLHERQIWVQKKLPHQLDPYYRGSNAGSVPLLQTFLLHQGIQRIELDNVAHGLSLDLPKGKISASVYFPYVYITTTLFCPSAGCDAKRKSLLKVKPCSRQCQKYFFKLRHKTMPKVIYLKGNTQLYKTSKLPIKDWRQLGIDRVVFEPALPI
jgi:hypothetical protein